jgi:hypothetical protein
MIESQFGLLVVEVRNFMENKQPDACGAMQSSNTTFVRFA